MSRPAIELSDTPMDILLKMSERNPGALTVLTKLLEQENIEHFMGPLGLFLDLDDMNIRGGQIWIGFKDHCKEDIDVFVKAVQDRDKEMVKTINERASTDEVAVTHGGSYRGD